MGIKFDNDGVKKLVKIFRCHPDRACIFCKTEHFLERIKNEITPPPGKKKVIINMIRHRILLYDDGSKKTYYENKDESIITKRNMGHLKGYDAMEARFMLPSKYYIINTNNFDDLVMKIKNFIKNDGSIIYGGKRRKFDENTTKEYYLNIILKKIDWNVKI